MLYTNFFFAENGIFINNKASKPEREQQLVGWVVSAKARFVIHEWYDGLSQTDFFVIYCIFLNSSSARMLKHVAMLNVYI